MPRLHSFRNAVPWSAVVCMAVLPIITSPASAGMPLGTFSIVAYDSLTGEVGVAVQSRVFGVGPRVAWARGGDGAIATQAQSNESFGPEGLLKMRRGPSSAHALSAREALESLLAPDTLRDFRQAGIVDADGGVANWTGSGCQAWAGDSAGAGFTCQGNILASAEVVAGMVRAFQETAGQELARRMLAALDAGQAAGGDKRGQQSAALLIGRAHPGYPEYAERYIDIRVDDHPEPIRELRRLYEVYEAQGLVQAHTRFATWMAASGDSMGARRERERVGQVMLRALENDLKDADMLNSLAWFAASNDLFLPQALQAVERAVVSKPEDTNILDTLAEVYFRLGRSEDAIRTEERALKIAPDDKYLRGQLERFKTGRR